MSSFTPTPQVVLSMDMGDSLAFFENSRNNRGSTPEERGKFSDFIKTYGDKLSFVFSSDQRGNLIKFRTSWGMGGSTNQSTFTLEILDAGGKFESAFFGEFSSSGTPYSETVAEWLANKDKNLQIYLDKRKAQRIARADTLVSQQESIADLTSEELHGNELDPEGNPWVYYDVFLRGKKVDTKKVPYNDKDAARFREGEFGNKPTSVIAGEEAERVKTRHGGEAVLHYTYSNYREDETVETLRKEAKELIKFQEEDSSYVDLSEKIRRLGALPYTTDMWISFGVGEDIATYAPAQLVRLVKIDYKLDPNHVRKFVLHLVPSSGILTIETNEKLLNVIRGSDRTVYRAVQEIMDAQGASVSVFDAVLLLIQNAYQNVVGTDLDVENFSYDMKPALRRKFSESVLAIIHQNIKAASPNCKINDEAIRSTKGFKDVSDYFIDSTPNRIGEGNEFKGASYLFERLEKGLSKTADATTGYVFKNRNAMVDVRLFKKYSGEAGKTGSSKTNFTMFSFYLNVIQHFCDKVGITFRASFRDKFNNKISWFPFAKGVSETALAKVFSRRQFISFALSKFRGSLVLQSNKPSGTEGGKGLKQLADHVLTQLDPQGRKPIILNYPEISFLKIWHETIGSVDGAVRDPTRNVLFIITQPFYSAVIKGRGKSHVNSLKSLTPEQRRRALTFVQAFDKFNQSEVPIGPIEGLHDPFSYLSFTSRELNAQEYLFTRDAIGEINTKDQFINYLRTNRIPAFVYGLKNSNILTFNFDLKMWWAQFLRLVPESLKNGILSAALGDPDDEYSNKALLTAVDYAKTDKSGFELDQFLEDLWYDARQAMVEQSGEEFKDPRGGPFAPAPTFTKHVGQGDIDTAFELRDLSDFAQGTSTKNSSDLPPLEEFKARIKQLIMLTLNAQAFVPKFQADSASDKRAWKDVMGIQNRLQSQGGFRGTITTLPLFQIMTPTMIGRASLLYFVEPQIFSNDKLNNEIPYKTWLSGEYWILGYEGIIDGGQVTSKFNILKKPYLRNVTIEE